MRGKKLEVKETKRDCRKGGHVSVPVAQRRKKRKSRDKRRT